MADASTSKRKHSDSPSADSPKADGKKKRRTRACLECRALKIACVPTEADGELCKRCVQYGFECLYVSHRRGRKPRSRITPLEAAALQARPATTQAAEETHVLGQQGSVVPTVASTSQSHAGPSRRIPPLAHLQSVAPATSSEPLPADEPYDPSAPTEAFGSLGAGEEDKSASLPQTLISSAPTKGRFHSMRTLLRPVGPLPSSYLPDVPSSSLLEDDEDINELDPISLGLVTEDVSQDLYDFFMKRMNANWYCILDPETDTYDSVRSRSVFLLTAVLSVATLFVRPTFSGDKSQDFSEGGLVHAQLAVHAVDLAMSSFADVRSSLETVQAFFVLSTWKDIDDCSSHLRFGFASQLCRDLELSTLAPMEKDMAAERLSWWRARQRMSLAIFIRDRILGNQLEWMHSLPLHDPLISSSATWHKEPGARPQDILLVAQVQVRRIQATYIDLIAKLGPTPRPGHVSNGFTLEGCSHRRMMLDTMVPTLKRRLEEWYIQWSRELAQLTKTSERSRTPQIDSTLIIMRIWQHSIQFHICSLALRDRLQPVSQDIIAAAPGSAPPKMDTAGDLIDLTALWPCIFSARALLESFSMLPKEHLRTAPDTISLLPTLAATFLWKLTNVQGDHPLAQEGFIQESLNLIRNATLAFGSAVMDPRDAILLHARFLASIAARIEQQMRAARKSARQKEASTPSLPVTVAGQSSLHASLGAPQPPFLMPMSSSSPAPPFLPPPPPSTFATTSPEGDLLPQMDLPAEWFTNEGIEGSAFSSAMEDLGPLSGFGDFAWDQGLNSFLGFEKGDDPTVEPGLWNAW